jgi:glycosyltransferase involved in cell wall biosynthesis
VARQVCEDLAIRLTEAGYQVITTSHHANRVRRVIDMVVTVLRRRSAFDVAQVDVFSGAAFIWAETVCWALRVARRPFILTLHGGALPTYARRWPGRIRRLLSSAPAVTTPSPYLAKEFGHLRADVILLPNPLDVSKYLFQIRSRPLPNLVWLRAFHRMYNPALAVRVAWFLRRQNHDAKLTMYGADSADGALDNAQELADRLGVSSNIDFAGGVTKSEVPRVLSQGDIFLNTTNVDNAPVSVIEAMACGLCVVSTNVGGIPHLLEHERDALLVPPNDPNAMAAAVHRILSEPGLAGRLSENARKKAERHDWSVVLPRWEGLFSELAAGGAAFRSGDQADHPGNDIPRN